ncbi:MAG: alpha,alpha-trehalase TreA [Cyclobacteriaceae bacterium]|jgi:alpha,alpha-trehalase
MKNRIAVLLVLLVIACSQNEQPATFLNTPLFPAVQQAAIFPDSKTFADAVPTRPLADILQDYDERKGESGFNLKSFIDENFIVPVSYARREETPEADLELHLSHLWDSLTRPADRPVAGSTLVPLPHPYVVPGGRFREIYYWDSYFTMLGLQVHDRYDLIRNMVNNFAFLIDSVGHIPNGNRTYYLNRSQPPFFALMVNLLADRDSAALLHYLPQLEKEHAFWMKGRENVQNPGDVANRVVMMPDGTILNRYWDDLPEPRPEAYKEDVEIQHQSGRSASDVYRHLKAGAESGWDFSSRWFDDGKTFQTIRTTDFVPVDLNCLLFQLETTISHAWHQKGNAERAREFRALAAGRRRAILTFMWNPEINFFVDYDFRSKSFSAARHLGGMFPFFMGFPQPDLSEKAAKVLEQDFLKPGGLTTTLVNSGQQWDAPNGWAPLQWIAYKGLRNYRQERLAEEIRVRWTRQNERVYRQTGKMMEKYNVMDTTLVAGGGEYPNQDGFGWTNGVYLAMKKRP